MEYKTFVHSKVLEVELSDGAKQHMKARRLKNGPVLLFDGKGNVAEAELHSGAFATIVQKHFIPPTPTKFVLCASSTKGNRDDVMVTKLQELGCDEYISVR